MLNTKALDTSKQTALILSNVAELTTGIIREIAGNDIANSINGSRLTNNALNAIVIQKVGSILETQLKGA